MGSIVTVDGVIVRQLISVGTQGPAGVVAASAPITYDGGTQTVGIDASGFVASVNGSTGAVVLTPADVVGPAVATDGAVALFDGTTGKLLEDGPVPGAANGLATLDSGGLIAPDTFARLPWYDELVVYDSMKSSSTVPLDEFVTPLGGTWNVLFGIWNRTVTGAATSGSGGGSVPDNYHLVVLDVGVTNFVAEYATGGGLSIRKSFVFAVIDRSNYLEVQIDFNQLRLRKIAAGVTTNLVQVTDVFPNSGGPYVLRVSKRNARIVVAPEGSLGLTHTLSAGDVTAYGSATQLGWYGLDTDPNGRARNLIVRRS